MSESKSKLEQVLEFLLAEDNERVQELFTNTLLKLLARNTNVS